MKITYEVADIFRLYGKEYREQNNLPYKKLKVIHKIEICRTAQLGGHIEQCDECVEIYSTLLKKRMESKPELRRCVIFDGRKWGFQTPECYKKFLELNQYISGYYKALFIAYYLALENFALSKHLLDMINNEFKKMIHWRFFDNLQDIFFWLNSEGFEIPVLTNSDFPVPVSAVHYLDYL